MRILFLFLGLVGWLVGRGSEIDGLRSRQDVVRFVGKVDPHFKRVPIFWEGGKESSAIDNRYFKLDMDGDGRVDLVVNGRYVLVILDLGKGHYRLINVGEVEADLRGIDRLLAIDSTGEPKKLVISRRQGVAWNDVQSKPSFFKDTLVVRFGEILEYNPAPSDGFRFDSINIVTSGCFGECPMYEMTIVAGGDTWYHAIRFNDEEGYFVGRLSNEELKDLSELLQYMALDKLDTNYEVNWTDDQTVFLVVGYDHKIKRVRDYGKQGTFGLQLLYARLFWYRKKLKWQRAEE